MWLHDSGMKMVNCPRLSTMEISHNKMLVAKLPSQKLPNTQILDVNVINLIATWSSPLPMVAEAL